MPPAAALTACAMHECTAADEISHDSYNNRRPTVSHSRTIDIKNRESNACETTRAVDVDDGGVDVVVSRRHAPRVDATQVHDHVAAAHLRYAAADAAASTSP